MGEEPLPLEVSDADHPTVLVVEDDPVVLIAVGRAFKQAGFEVVSARSAREAMDALPQRVDLLVADVRLGEMDGVELASRMTRRGLARSAMLMTGFRSDQLPEAAGQLPIVRKPFSNTDIVEAAKRALTAEAPPHQHEPQPRQHDQRR